ncbi:MAG: alpha/beta hydrolase [Pseudomonadota bacterium]
MREGNVKVSIPSEELDIHFIDYNSSPDKPVLVCFHGNSGSANDFYQQFSSLGEKYRIVAFDLPGHGSSSAVMIEENKKKIYSFPGYADIMAKSIKALGIEDFFVLGVSLGGHNALSLLAEKNKTDADPEVREVVNNIRGLIITGTPPLDLSLTTSEEIFAQFNQGFRQNFMEQLSPEIKKEMQDLGLPYLAALLGYEKNLNDGTAQSNRIAELFVSLQDIDLREKNNFMVNMVKQTKGEARKHMIDNMVAGNIDNQRKTVEKTNIPLLIIAGTEDKGISVEYLRTLALPSNAQLKEIPGGHGVFLLPNFSQEIDNFIDYNVANKTSTKSQVSIDALDLAIQSKPSPLPSKTYQQKMVGISRDGCKEI